MRKSDDYNIRFLLGWAFEESSFDIGDVRGCALHDFHAISAGNAGRVADECGDRVTLFDQIVNNERAGLAVTTCDEGMHDVS